MSEAVYIDMQARMLTSNKVDISHCLELCCLQQYRKHEGTSSTKLAVLNLSWSMDHLF